MKNEKCIFPEQYSRPVLAGIVEAGETGWSAKCASGGGPTSGWANCTNGPNVGHAVPCPGHGSGDSDSRLFPGNGSGRVLDPGEVSRGL